MKRTYEEMVELANQLADYIIETKSSTRKTAEHFQVSVFTVSDYISRILPKINPEKFKLVQEIFEMNKPTVADEKVIRRIKATVELLKQGHTVVEIADILECNNAAQIYEDLSTRLYKITDISDSDKELVKEILYKNRMQNLKQNSSQEMKSI